MTDLLCLFTTFPGRVKQDLKFGKIPFQFSGSPGFASGPEELLEFALYTGGDFELIFTIDPERLKKVQNICNLTIIGECTEYETGIMLESRMQVTAIKQLGYQQLKAETAD